MVGQGQGQDVWVRVRVTGKGRVRAPVSWSDEKTQPNLSTAHALFG